MGILPDSVCSDSPSPAVRALLERIARCAYMLDQHRQGIALNQQRILEARAELARIEASRDVRP